MKKWYHDPKGNVSSLRILVIPAGYVALAVVIAGAVGVFFNTPNAIALCGVGSGLFSVASGVKAWQKEKECV
jgi:hypothetical protein